MNRSISINPAIKRQRLGSFLKIILLAWLLVGTLDIAAATIQTLINGREPAKMLQFIASGVFGKQSFSGGTLFAFHGMMLHYCIALGWTVLFFMLYPRINFLAKNIVLTGICYGLLVWLIMNMIVIPLSDTPPLKFKLPQAVIGMMILIIAIGLPLSFMAKKYFSRSESLTIVRRIEN